ncbi:MAG: DUF3303 family protein [Acidobacteria bacterium]|nr:DUF3303 family protein [Acidobacteriota bacterium]
MKIMIVWKTMPGSYKPAVENFLLAGAPVPPGIKTVGRWHTPGSTLGWHLVEGNDLTAVAQHVAEWANLLELETYPVIEDAEAASAASKVYGK